MILKAALIGNASALGYNWIYDMPFLKRLSKDSDLLFHKPNQAIYDQSKNAYFAYPLSDIGDVSFQGHIAIWLYKKLKENFYLNADQYEDLIYEEIKTGSSYQGYIESFGRKMIEDRKKMETDKAFIAHFENDDQLVGFIPWIVFREIKRPTISALKFTRVFSTDTTYDLFFDLFNVLTSRPNNQTMQEGILKLVASLPKHQKIPFEKAIEMTDTPLFIKDYAGTACAIHLALPVIIHILYHTHSFEEALKKNTVIGGASSDRGMLLGALLSFYYDIPEAFVALTERSLRDIN
jgi:hypothetical protein